MPEPSDNPYFVCGYQGSKLYKHIEKHGLITK